MTLGNRVAVMRDGSLQQVAPSMEVYLRPANVFVAGFVGSPAMNFFRDGGPLPEHRGKILGVRPQDIEVVEPGSGDLKARVDVIEPLGSELLVHLRRDVGGVPDAAASAPVAANGSGEEEEDGEIRALVPPESGIAVDEAVGLRFRRDRLHLFDAGTERRVN